MKTQQSKASANGRSSKSTSGKTSKSNQTEYGMEESKLMKLFVDGLKDIYWVEKALTKALPKMQKNATADELIQAIESHLEETQGHIEKVEQVFEIIGKKPQAKKCEAMEGLIREAQEVMDECDEGAMCDAGIICSAQKVEHYEIASYGCLRTFAQTLGLEDAAEILDSILEEEKAADEKLTGIAETTINIRAAEEVE